MKREPIGEAYQGADGQWYWRLRGKNGEISIPPEGHTSAKDAKRAFRTAKRLLAQAQEIVIADVA